MFVVTKMMQIKYAVKKIMPYYLFIFLRKDSHEFRFGYGVFFLLILLSLF